MARLATTLFFILVIFGIVMLASAGIAEGQKKFDSPYYYPLHQLWYGLIPGLIVFVIFSKIAYKKWRTFALPLLLLAVGLLVLVFVPELGVAVKGAKRWLAIGPLIVQPSEFLKFALVLYLAAWFANKHRAASLIPFFIVLAFVATLLILQPDFGTLGVTILIAVALYFFSGAKLWHFGVLLLVLGVLLGTLAIAAPYRFDRIKAYLNPQEDQQGTSYHINQAIITIGSGGIWGLGYGQSKQKLGYLPEPVGDSIFAIIVEELGLAGGVTFLVLLTAFLLSLLALARHTDDPFGRLFTLGVAVWIGGQAFINIAAISGLIPLTGIPLPLVSFGSSSLVSIMAAMGIVRSISRS